MLDRLPQVLLRLEGLAVVAAAVALYFHEDFGWILFVALIWLAHIGADRLFGYGLKYPTAFNDTHLSRV